MDQLLLGVELKILAGASGIADPAIVEFDDKRLKPFPARLRRCLSSALGHEPGAHAQQLARVIAGTVLCGELSLLAALSSNHLISAHLKLNRKPTNAS